MADNNFRSFRNRDARANDLAAHDTARDPLAELARLIGQSDQAGEFGARRGQAESYAEAPVAEPLQWSADDGYAEPALHPDDRSIQPRLAEPYPDYRAYPTEPLQEPQEPDIEYVPPLARAAPPARDFVDARYAAEPADDAVARDAYYREEEEAPDPFNNAVPSLAPQSHDDGYETNEQWQDNADDPSYATDEPDE
jgi:hypothetical protein